MLLPCILTVVPMEIFVSCVGDWQPLEGQFGRDLDSFTPWFLLFLSENLGIRKFYPGSSLAFWLSGVPKGS